MDNGRNVINYYLTFECQHCDMEMDVKLLNCKKDLVRTANVMPCPVCYDVMTLKESRKEVTVTGLLGVPPFKGDQLDSG